MQNKWFSILFLILSTLIFSLQLVSAQSIALKNYKLRGQKVIFASHFGDKINELKSASLDENGFSFFYNENLHSGIYYLIFQDSTLIEFMYDSLFPGKISIESIDSTNKINIEGPSVTFEFNNYLVHLSKLTENKNHTTSDSLLFKYSNKVPGSILEAYLKAQISIDVPDYTPTADIVNKDSAIWKYQLEYYSKHFLDNLDFSDSRLIYTPVYIERINYFLDKTTRNDCSSLVKNVDFVMQKATSNEEIHQFTANYLLNKFAEKKNIAQYECVYVHLIEKYFLKSGYSWITNEKTDFLTNEYNRCKPATIGEIAPDIKMPNANGDVVALNNLSNRYLLIYFYNYDCPLCDKVTPEIRKIVSRYDYLDIGVLAVCLGDNYDKWVEYLTTKKISGWNNFFDKETINQIALKYNLSHTPTLFLLNNEKIIIDKNFTVAQFEKYLFNIATKENKRK